MDPWDTLPLYEPGGKELRIVDDKARYTTTPQVPMQASLSGPAPVYSRPIRTPITPVFKPPKEKKLSHDELMKIADKMEKDMAAQHAASLSRGPSVGSATPIWLQNYMAEQEASMPENIRISDSKKGMLGSNTGG